VRTRVLTKLIPPAAVVAAVVVGFFSLVPGTSPGRALGAGDPVIAAAGDIACDPTNPNFNGGAGTSANCRQLYTSNLLTNAGLAAVLPLGDTQYECGGLPAFQQSYDQSWGRLKSITRPVVGNHEYLTSGGTGCDSTNAGAHGYYTYFGQSAGDAGHGWYSYDLGSWHLIALNSNCGDVGGCGASSPQGQWLASDLASHPNDCTLAYWHIPLFSSGGRAAQNSLPLWQMLYAAGADVILNGHDHVYERFAPQDPTGQRDEARGLREFIVGTGGSNHTTFGTIVPNSEVQNASTFGVLKLTLHPTSYEWQFVPEAGGSFTDSGTGACTLHTSPPPPLFSDDFESGDLSHWTSVTGLGTDSSDVHSGSWAARATSTGATAAYAFKQLSSAQSGLSYKLWFKLHSQGSNVVDLLKLRTATNTALLTVFASPTGVLGYQNNVTGLSTYSKTPLSSGVWHSLEVRAMINDANSQVQTFLDGQPVPDLTKTESLGTTPIGRIQLGENITGRTYDVSFDDVSAAAIDTTAPSAPSGLSAQSGQTSVVLSWSPSSDNVGVAGYNVYLGNSRIASTVGTSYTATGLTCGTSYAFGVEAYDAAGNISGRTPLSVSTAACPAAPLFSDDFESGDLSHWTSVTGLGTDSSDVHSGSWAARATSTGATAAYAFKQLSSAQSGLSYKLWFKLHSQGSNVVDLLKLRTATNTALLTVFASPTGVLGYQNNVTGLSTYSKTPLSSGVWHSLEVRAMINDANSQVQTFLDGQPVPDLTKTESLGTTPIGRIQLGENITGRTYDVSFDDVLVAPWTP
jgi:fibronectin type III domain protein/calcineurin-like phosphoesterase family protein